MKVDLLTPSGYCGGVLNVLKLINYVVEKHSNQPIYCVGQVVHNQDCIDSITSKGVKVLVGDKKSIIDKIDCGVVIFSAHGTDEEIIRFAIKKGLITYNAVCPNVDKSFMAIKNKTEEGYDIIYIGKKGHDEAIAAMSFSNKLHFVEKKEDVEDLNIENKKIAVINQTTLSSLDLREIYELIEKRYPSCIVIDEICNTTRIRQENLIKNANNYDGVIIVGDKSSSNTMSLYKIAKSHNQNTIMILNDLEIDYQWLKNKKSVLIASGASTPNAIIEEIMKKVKIN